MKHLLLVVGAVVLALAGLAIAGVGAWHGNVTICLVGAVIAVLAVGLALPAQLGTAIQAAAPLLPYLKRGE